MTEAVEYPDLVVVGAGLFGLTVAQQAVEHTGARVHIIDIRDHIGGNAYSYMDEETGAEIHKYGAHLFHTSNRRVWDYVNRFTSFTNYVHRVYATHDGEVYPLPINLGTINQFFHAHYTPAEAKALIEQQAGELAGTDPANLNDKGIQLIGRPLYEAFIKNYTGKQWQTDPSELPAAIIKRLPVRFTYDDNYFNALYQGIPNGGYTAMVEKMLAGTEVRLNVDYLAEKAALDTLAEKVVYTGPVDAYFGYRLGALQYRSVRFETEVLDTDNYQGNAVVNYTDAETPYTRIIEHKHFEFGTQPKTVISREYSAEWKKGDEPYYPVNDAKNGALYAEYKQLADAEPGVIFGGRLGEYKYYDMDKVIEAALDVVQKELG